MKKAQLPEAGVFIPLLAIITVALFGLSALILDIGIMRIASLQIQYASDSASIAGARQIDGSKNGWRRSKIAALLSLQQSPVIGSDSLLAGMLFDQSIPGTTLDNFYEPLTSYLGNKARSGTIEYTLERGVYFTGLNDTNDFTFRSYEGKEYAFQLPLPAIAHAVKVSGVNTGLGAFFARVFGMGTIPENRRAALALSDGLDNECVLPIAIPACEFLLKTDDIDGPFVFDELNQSIWDYQVQRELTFLDGWWNFADPVFGFSSRRDGIIRSESYPRGPYIPNPIDSTIQSVDRLGFPIKGIIGFPKLEYPVVSTFDFDTTSLLEFQNQMQSIHLNPDENSICQLSHNSNDMRLGARFQALDNFEDLDNDGNRDAAGTNFFNPILVAIIQSFIADMIKNSTDTFASQFFTGGAPDKHFPFLKGLRGVPPAENPADFPDYAVSSGGPEKVMDLRGVPPAGVAGAYRSFPSAHLTPNSDPSKTNNPWHDVWNNSPQLMWTNPLCHHWGVDSGGNAIIPRTLTANPPPKAPRVKAMLIAPRDNPDGTPSTYKYCDYQNYLNSSGSSTMVTRPINWSNPVVVGWAYVNVFDVQLLDLSIGGTVATPPGDRNPMQFTIGANDPVRNALGYFDDCSQVGSNNWEESQGPPFNRNPQLLWFPNTSPMYCDDVGSSCPGGPGCCPQNPACDANPALCAGPTFCARSRRTLDCGLPGPCTEIDEFPEEWPGLTGALGVAQYFPYATVVTHPLPAPVPGCPDATSCAGTFNYYDSGQWEFRDRAAERGCSGIRARVRPEFKFLTNSSDFAKRQTRLVPLPGDIQ